MSVSECPPLDPKTWGWTSKPVKTAIATLNRPVSSQTQRSCSSDYTGRARWCPDRRDRGLVEVEVNRVRAVRLHDASHPAATTLLPLGIPERAVLDVNLRPTLKDVRPGVSPGQRWWPETGSNRRPSLSGGLPSPGESSIGRLTRPFEVLAALGPGSTPRVRSRR